MCTCTADGTILPICFTVPLNQLYKFSVVNKQGQPVSIKKQRQTKPTNINNYININNNSGNINVDRPVRQSIYWY